MECTDESCCMQSVIPLNPLIMKNQKNSRENLKTQQKTQNSRGKLKKSAFFETPGARKAFKKEACIISSISHAAYRVS